MSNDQNKETNQNNISLSFFDFDCDPKDITEELQLSPTSIGKKGGEYLIGPPEKRIIKTYDYNYWRYKWSIDSNEFIGNIITRFIKEIIEPREAKLVSLASKSSIQFQVAQYYYDGCNPGVSINKECIKTLADISADIDIDIYCLGE
ncbi:MAG: DUF4279 domain-containing protein [Bacteroidales bacterium]|nr:DUF4279 domain-containing protein [Bacteroidales bacterium]